jgi:hypothetical protein
MLQNPIKETVMKTDLAVQEVMPTVDTVVTATEYKLIRLYLHVGNTRELLLCFGEPTQQELERAPELELVYHGDNKDEAYNVFVGMATMIESTHG